MRIEDRPKKKFLSGSSEAGLVIVGTFAFICVLLVCLLIVSKWDYPVYEGGLQGEPIVTVFEEEIITEGVVFEQNAPLISEDELMAKVIMAEAGREPFVGKVAVATVILNRAEVFDKTIYEVLTSPCQFASPAYIVTEDCYRAVEFAKANRDLFPSDMIYFRNRHYHEDLGYPYIQIGGHYFSTEEEHKEK